MEIKENTNGTANTGTYRGNMGAILNPESRYGGKVQRSLCKEPVITELVEELILPEYLPEILKLLKGDVTLAPASKFVSGGSAQFNGTLTYHILYVGTDGKAHTAEFPKEYAFQAPFDTNVDYDGSEGIAVSVDTCAESLVSRVSGARKISVRLQLSSRVSALAYARIDGGREIAGDDVQKLEKSVSYVQEMSGSHEEMELSDVWELPWLHAEYLGGEAEIFMEEVRAAEGYAECRGTVYGKFLFAPGEGENLPQVVTRKQSFSEAVEVDGLLPGDKCCAFGWCTAMQVTVPGREGATDGEEGGGSSDSATEGTEASCRMRFCLQVRAFHEDEMAYVADAYSTEGETTCEMREETLPTLLAVGNGNRTVDSTVSFADIPGFPADGRVRMLDVSGSVNIDGILREDEKGRCVIGGTCHFSLLWSPENLSDPPELFLTEIPVPIRFDPPEITELPDTFRSRAVLIAPHVRLEENQMKLSGELVLSYDAVKNHSVSEALALTVQEPEESKTKKARHGYTICYPDGGDTLWSISKKYRVPVNETARENGMDPGMAADASESLQGVRYMIV